MAERQGLNVKREVEIRRGGKRAEQRVGEVVAAAAVVVGLAQPSQTAVWPNVPTV